MIVSLESRFDKVAQVDFQVTLGFINPPVSVDVFASDLRYTTADGVRILSVGEPADNLFLKDLLSNAMINGANVDISISDSSELVMEFASLGFTLAALPDDDWESWSARFEPPVADNATFIACLPGGRLEQFGPAR